MSRQIDKLVATFTYDPEDKSKNSYILVGMGDRTYKKPFEIVNVIKGDEALKLWNELTIPGKDDQNGGTGNAIN